MEAQIINAIENNDIELLENILNNNTNIDLKFLAKSQQFGRSFPLRIAAEMNNIKIVQILLNYDSSLEHLIFTDRLGITTLMHICARNDTLDIIKLLLDTNSSIEHLKCQSVSSYTALMTAIKFKMVNNVRALLEANSSLEHLQIQDYDGNYALIIASSMDNNKAIIQLILKAHNNLEANNSLALLKLLNKRGNTILHELLELRKDSALYLIINSNPLTLNLDFISIQNKEGNNIFMLLCYFGLYEIFNKILTTNEILESEFLDVKNNDNLCALDLVKQGLSINNNNRKNYKKIIRFLEQEYKHRPNVGSTFIRTTKKWNKTIKTSKNSTNSTNNSSNISLPDWWSGGGKHKKKNNIVKLLLIIIVFIFIILLCLCL